MTSRYEMLINDTTGDDGKGRIETYRASKDVIEGIKKYANETITYEKEWYSDSDTYEAKRAIYVGGSTKPIKVWNPAKNDFDEEYILVVLWRYRAFYRHGAYEKFDAFSI